MKPAALTVEAEELARIIRAGLDLEQPDLDQLDPGGRLVRRVVADVFPERLSCIPRLEGDHRYAFASLAVKQPVAAHESRRLPDAWNDDRVQAVTSLVDAAHVHTEGRDGRVRRLAHGSRSCRAHDAGAKVRFQETSGI